MTDDPWDINRVTGCYILDAHDRPVPEPDFLKFAMWMAETNRQVALTERHISGTRFVVSTVFIGISFEEHPRLWETMVFRHFEAKETGTVSEMSGREPVNDYTRRYFTKTEAELGHLEVVKFLDGGFIDRGPWA